MRRIIHLGFTFFLMIVVVACSSAVVPHTAISTNTISPPPSRAATLTSTPTASILLVAGLSIEEHLLSEPPDYSTDQLTFRFASGDKSDVFARSAPYRDYRVQVSAYNNRVLAPFGYSQKDYQESDGNGYSFWRSDIYRGDQRIVHGAYPIVKPVSVNASGTDFIVEVEIAVDGTYVLTRNSFEERPYPPEREHQLYVGDQLLSIETVGSGEFQEIFNVYLDHQLVYQSKINTASSYGDRDGPWSYDGHWAVVLLDHQPNARGESTFVQRLIQDGQDVNVARGYEQSFQFAVLNGHPFYFYQKQGKIGISFDGQEIARDYDEIPHYFCCSPALLNPGISMNMVWFFARRGKDWHYVDAYIPLN